jgi:GTP cyclohydrolase II
LGGRGRQISEFEASLVYKVSSRTGRAIQKNHVLKKQTKTHNKIVMSLILLVFKITGLHRYFNIIVINYNVVL